MATSILALIFFGTNSYCSGLELMITSIALGGYEWHLILNHIIAEKFALNKRRIGSHL